MIRKIDKANENWNDADAMNGAQAQISSATERRQAADPITIRLGPMAARALAASGQVRPERLQKTLAQAIAYYLGPARDSAGWAFPTFLVADAEPAGSMTVELEPRVWDEIHAEAERQEVEPDAMVQHAALFFGAARDAGRLTDRIVQELESQTADSGGRRVG